MEYTLHEIAEITGAQLHGDPDCKISGVATLQNAKAGMISFLANRRYYRYLKSTKAAAVILSPADKDDCPVNCLVSPDPYLTFVKAVRYLQPQASFTPGIDGSAIISGDVEIAATACIGANTTIGSNVKIDENAFIGPGCVIAENVSIGKDTRLVANVTICNDVHIGDGVLLHPGVVVGADGFGLANENGKWLKIPQLGSVVIGDGVELGANTTVDRGALEDTVIEDGVKIDNQVQIGHNVRIGAHTAIAGCVAIAGSVTIGKHCMIGGLSAISGHIEITDRVIITGMSGVSNSIKEPGVYSSGIPATDNKTWRRNAVRFKHLDEMAGRLKELELLLKKSD